MATLKLSVVIPTHQRLVQLAAAISSILKQDLPRDAFEVLIVSNFQDESLCEQVDVFARLGLQIQCLSVGSLGVNRARNLGLRAAQGEVILFLDDDCRLRNKSHFSTLLKRFESRCSVDVRGGPYENSVRSSRAGRGYNAVANTWATGRGSQSGPYLGGNLSLRKSALFDDDGFDETIVYGGSEVSLQLKLKARGVRFEFDHDLAVEHEAEGGVWTFACKAWHQGQRKSLTKGPSTSLRSFLALVDVSARPAENLERLVFGTCYGGIVQLGSLLGRNS